MKSRCGDRYRFVQCYMLCLPKLPVSYRCGFFFKSLIGWHGVTRIVDLFREDLSYQFIMYTYILSSPTIRTNHNMLTRLTSLSRTQFVHIQKSTYLNTVFPCLPFPPSNKNARSSVRHCHTVVILYKFLTIS